MAAVPVPGIGHTKVLDGKPKEFKQRLLSALYKLGDRDTQGQAAQELERICESVSPDTLPAVLTCLFDTDDR
jgi:hypothetical protein